ncbi:MAG: cytochrome c [candidate division NC10 bacterium]|nr:cytochrome c [candidate division NC10 bacterium]MBI4414600.1 cytochrome c [candidate division NC10 bacterium]
MRAFFLTAVLVAGLALALPADAADLALGENVYGKRCASCHAADGRGDAKMAEILKVSISDLRATTKSDQELRTVISKGKPPMPAFEKQLSSDELQAVVAYVKSLTKGGS